MGFSTVAATAIIGISIIMAIEIMAGTTIPTITDLHDAYDDMRDRAIEQLQTDINITDTTPTANGTDHHDLVVTIENTGSTTLKTSDFDILINGTKKIYSCSKSYIHPENTATFTIEYIEGRNTNKRIKAVTNNGIEEYYTYSVT